MYAPRRLPNVHDAPELANRARGANRAVSHREGDRAPNDRPLVDERTYLTCLTYPTKGTRSLPSRLQALERVAAREGPGVREDQRVDRGALRAQPLRERV